MQYLRCAQGPLGANVKGTEPTLRIPEGFHEAVTGDHECQVNQLELYL